MARAFRRGLPNGALEYLRSLPPWWRDVLQFRYGDEGDAPRPLLFALRDGYFNVYVEGQSVLKIGFDTRQRSDGVKVRCKLHRKYALGPDAGAGYLSFDGAKVVDPTSKMVIQTYQGADTLLKWVNAARSYAGREKKGVAAIAERHPTVIDVEMALPANEPSTPDQIKSANRMDIVALEGHGTGYRLAFYEAKLFSNSELRARNYNPRVLARQLTNYCNYVSGPERRRQVLAAYRETCRFNISVSE